MSGIRAVDSGSPLKRRLLRYISHSPLLATLALTAIIGRLAAQLVWALVPTPNNAWTVGPAPIANPSARNSVDIDSIVAANLFGHYVSTPPPDAAQALEPEVPLNFSISGIFAFNGNGKKSRVLISSADEAGQVYAVGDEVSKGVSIAAIFESHVDVLHNGRLEHLRLDGDRQEADSSPYRGVVLNAQQPIQESSPEQMLAITRTKMANDSASVSNYIRTQPNILDGHVHGIRVFPGADRSLFDATGLRPGDIVTSLNGKPLNDPSNIPQILSSFSSTSNLVLVLDRGGHPETVRISAPR